MNISARNKRETFERDLEQTLKEKVRGQERETERSRERTVKIAQHLEISNSDNIGMLLQKERCSTATNTKFMIVQALAYGGDRE
jgi:hypothetical protein